MTIGRSVVNVAQKARGKQAIKYEFEVIPFTACKYLPYRNLHGTDMWCRRKAASGAS